MGNGMQKRGDFSLGRNNSIRPWVGRGEPSWWKQANHKDKVHRYTVKGCIQMCIRARAHARAHVHVLNRFSTVLVMCIH